VSGGVVATAEAVPGDLVPGVRLEHEFLRQLHRGAVADDRAVQNRDEAPFREVVDLPADFTGGVSGKIIVGAAHQCGDPGDIATARTANLEPRLAFAAAWLLGSRRGHSTAISASRFLTIASKKPSVVSQF